MKLTRQELLSMALGGVVFLVTIAWATNGLLQPELILETRRQVFCFSGTFKNVFCLSVLLFCSSLIYVVYFGLKKAIYSRNYANSMGLKSKIILCFFIASMCSV